MSILLPEGMAQTGRTPGCDGSMSAKFHRSDAANGDDSRLVVATNNAIVVGRSRNPMDEAPAGTGTQAAGSKSAPLLHHHIPETTTQNRSVV